MSVFTVRVMSEDHVAPFTATSETELGRIIHALTTNLHGCTVEVAPVEFGGWDGVLTAADLLERALSAMNASDVPMLMIQAPGTYYQSVTDALRAALMLLVDHTVIDDVYMYVTGGGVSVLEAITSTELARANTTESLASWERELLTDPAGATRRFN